MPFRQTKEPCAWSAMGMDAVVGLQAVTLGMIPGAGGTQHVPRLAGIAHAFEIICSGRRVPAREALALGLVDAIASSDLRTDAIQMARQWQQAGSKRCLGAVPVPADSPERIARATEDAMRAGRRAGSQEGSRNRTGRTTAD